MTVRLRPFLAAALVAAAATVLPVAPASAAACSDAGGATVVVDAGGLDGSLSQTCVGGGGEAADLFAQAGHTLERVQRFPGAVCRVDDQPESAGCVNMPPTNAYWGLFWSNGTSGSWVYASQGVDGLDIPAGGSVAFAWQASSSRRNPAVAPPDHDGSAPSDPGGGSGGGTGGGTGGGSSTGGTPGPGAPSGSPSASASPSGADGSAPVGKRARAGERDHGVDHARRDRPRDPRDGGDLPGDGATVAPDDADTNAAAASQGVADGGLPLWLVGLAAACLLAVGVVAAVVRRAAVRPDGGA